MKLSLKLRACLIESLIERGLSSGSKQESALIVNCVSNRLLATFFVVSHFELVRSSTPAFCENRAYPALRGIRTR